MALTLDNFLLFKEELTAKPAAQSSVSALDALAETLSGGGDFLRPIPSPREFITDPYFVGSLANDDDALPPAIRESWIKEASTDYNELILAGAIGVYKTQRAVLHLMYIACVTLCLRDPGAYYGLGSGAALTMAFVSISKEKAKEVGFNRLRQFVYGSPFFMENPLNRPDRAFKGVLKFKNGLDIRPAVANEGGVLGNALIALVIDEAAFMNVTEKSKKARGEDSTYDAAANIYSQAKIRMKSRFMREGKKFPCKVIIASSAQFPDDFVSRRQLELIQEPDPTVLVSDMPIWEGKPKSFSKVTFRVEIGAESRFSRILDEDDDGRPDARIIHVPINLRDDFERDIDRSIRDLAGIPLLTLAPLFTDRSRITDSYRTEAKGFADWECLHPFSTEETTLLNGTFNRHLVCAKSETNGMWYPKKNPHATRFIHIDPSFGKQDATGFAMVHATGYEMTREKDHKTGQTIEKYNVSVYTDLLLRIVRPDEPGSEINWSDIEGLIQTLQECGYEIGLITTDGVGAFLVQRLKQQGFDSEIQSVDRTIDPYLTLKSCFQEGRVSSYEYPILEDELFGLEWNKKRNKIDHPRRGCFVGETRIPLLDGTCPEIKDLVGKEVWVYSATPEGAVVPGKARGRATKTTTSLVDVVLDSGAVFRCTPDHRCMLIDGSYKEAKDLRPGIDRLMPLTRNWPVNGGYEKVSSLGKFGSILTHRAVSEFLDGPIPDGYVVHHKNANKTDNRPENLEQVSKAAHSEEHSTERWWDDAEYRKRLYDGLRAFNTSPEGRKKHSDAMRKTAETRTPDARRASARRATSFRRDISINDVLALRTDPLADTANSAARILGCGRNVVVRVLRENGYASWEDAQARGPAVPPTAELEARLEAERARSAVVAENRREHARTTLNAQSSETRTAAARRHSNFRDDVTLVSLEGLRYDPAVTSRQTAAKALGCSADTVNRVLRDAGYSAWGEFLAKHPVENNHKVRWVIPVELETDVTVYDLEVDHFSNFALAAGVFVHNSKDTADALCGAVYNAVTKYFEYDAGSSKITATML